MAVASYKIYLAPSDLTCPNLTQLGRGQADDDDFETNLGIGFEHIKLTFSSETDTMCDFSYKQITFFKLLQIYN